MAQDKFNEDTLSEQPAIKQLHEKLGYEYLHGDQLDPDLIENCERLSRKDVILEGRLKKKLAEINPRLTRESIDKAVRKITHIQAETTLEANRIFHKMLISGVSFEQDAGARRQNVTVNFIDFKEIDKNEFLAVNQLWIRGQKTADRPDIVIFINGIPIVIIECKSPVAKNTGVIDAQTQLLRYQKEIPQFFRTNELLIGCNLFGAKYGTIEAPLEHYHEWKEKESGKAPNMREHPTVKEMLKLGLIEEKDLTEHPPMQEVLIAAILKKKNLLDIIQNYIVFDYSKEEHKVVKKICRYQQFSAVNKIVKRVTTEDDKRGIIWHWQDSGKSLIMVFTAVKLRREEEKLKNPIILIVTDRRKLDRQITENFQNCNFPNPAQTKSMEELYSLLKTGSGHTIMTTIQKFRKPLVAPLSKSKNIIVLTDEAHRTQYGNFALNLRNALPNASFFAFTGTPLNKKDRNTYRHFSPPNERYLDRYDMRDSEEDEATKPIKYQSRLPNLQIVGDSIDALLKGIFPEKPQKELAEIKRRYATIDTLLRAPRRVERVAMDIVDHFNAKIGPNGFKAMIVACDRPTAVKYKEALDKLIGKNRSTIVMTINNADPQEWKEKYRRTPTEEDLLTGKEVFQNPQDPLQFLIVCDMLLTGFDAPILQAMYLDQRMKEHTLLQAVARTNRPYPRKNFGLVVDYVGVGRELAQALAIFDKEDLEGIFSVDDIKREIIALGEAHKKTIVFFKSVKRGLPPEEVIQKCLEILCPEDTRVEFETAFREFAKGMDILMPDPCVNPFVSDFKFLGMIREGAKNLYRDESLALENCSKKVEALIHAHIIDSGVTEILAPIHITAPDFKEKLQIKGSAKAKASHVEYAIREVINAKVAEDPRFYNSLKEQLETAIETDRKRRKDEADLLKDLVSIKEQEERRDLVAKEKNLTPDEFAFYGLLEAYEQSSNENADEKRIALAKKLFETIKSKIVIDWIEKEDAQKEMRREIKNILREIKFPEDKSELFTREALDLARVRLPY